MSTVFVTQDIWPQIKAAARESRQACSVAVAYFGANASKLLPLPRGSRLVVDASERAVASGQTCPADLSRLVNHGVKVFSVPNLHAKVFVFGRAAWIGSANVSQRSAAHLVEAVVRTTDPAAVRAAREFVREHCLHELTPTVLKRLARLYRPPRIPGGKRTKKLEQGTARRPALPRLLLAQLDLEEWSDEDQSHHDAGLRVAKRHREHPRSFEFDSFRFVGVCSFERGDVVIQVTNEGRGRDFVSPPGNVRYVRTYRRGKKQTSFVYLELPARRRRALDPFARKLGRGALKLLLKQGLVRKAAFARALLNAWAD